MDCRDHKSILKNPVDEIAICPGYNISTKRASFNDNGILKKIIIDRLNENSLTEDLPNVSSLKESAPVLEVLEETIVSVPIEDGEEKSNNEEEIERRKLFEEKRKCHERVNIKELLKQTESDFEEDSPE